MYLALRAEKVFVVIRGENLYKSMSSYLVHRIEQMPNIEVLRHTRVRRCEGATCLTAVELEDTETKSTRLIETPANSGAIFIHRSLTAYALVADWAGAG
jgi:thioredoxin reductase (NADPH)